MVKADAFASATFRRCEPYQPNGIKQDPTKTLSQGRRFLSKIAALTKTNYSALGVRFGDRDFRNNMCSILEQTYPL